MKFLRALMLMAMLSLAGLAGARASEGFDDIAKLAKSGIAEEVLAAYVQASPIAYDLTVDEILYLNDLGVSSKTITEVVDHGKQIRAGNGPRPEAAGDVELAQPLDAKEQQQLDNDIWNTEQPYTPDPVAQPVVAGADPTVLASPYSSLDDNDSVRETEIVRDTVYVPTVVNAPAANDVSISTFYEALTPYGTWVNIEDTWCWQPSVVVTDVSWRPYAQRGHWTWTDQGWFWESDYSWGWAPFHYGRWHHHAAHGWLWSPDTTWGPAWVSWRESDTHLGWAPLPPSARWVDRVGLSFGGKNWNVDIGFGLGYRDYAFVPRDQFCSRSLGGYIAPSTQYVNIYNRTTIIQNNITYVDNRVVVRGPGRERIERDTRVTLREVRISDRQYTAGQPLVNTQRYDRERNEIQIYRPTVQAAAAVTPVVIAQRQLAAQERRVDNQEKRTANQLAASAKADELRERHLAAVDARKETQLVRQQSMVENLAEKRAESNEAKLNRELQQEQNEQKRAAITANIKAEQQRKEEARKQKLELDRQAGEQKKVADQLARDRDRVAHENASAANAKNAAENKARLAAERQAREQAQKQSAADAQKAAADRRAQLAAQRNSPNAPVANVNSNDTHEREAQTKLEAQRAAREAAQKTQAEQMAKQKAQLEAERVARQQKQQQDAALRAQQNAAENAQAAAAKAAKAQQLAQEKAQRDAAQDAAEAQRKAQMEANRAAQQAKAQQDAVEHAKQQEAARLAAQQKAQQVAAERAQRDAAQDAAEAQRKAQLEANRAANQAKLQQDAQERAVEAQKRAAEKAQRDAADDAADAQKKAQMEAQRQANQAEAAKKAAERQAAAAAQREATQKAAAERAAAAAAAREARKLDTNDINPATGQPYTQAELNALKKKR